MTSIQKLAFYQNVKFRDRSCQVRGGSMSLPEMLPQCCFAVDGTLRTASRNSIRSNWIDPLIKYLERADLCGHVRLTRLLMTVE